MNNQPRQIGNYLTATDPTRGQMAASYAVVPGGPQNNNPQNVTSINSGPNTYGSAYGDMQWNNDPRLAQVMPYPVSGKPQNMVLAGLKGYNAQADMIPQPPPQMADAMTADYNGKMAQMRGLIPSPMGMTGLPAQPAPGGVMPSPQQAPNTMPLQTMPPEQAAGMNQMARMGQGSPKGMA